MKSFFIFEIENYAVIEIVRFDKKNRAIIEMRKALNSVWLKI